jgi:hypothetical protein
MTWKNRFKQTKITDSKYGFTNWQCLTPNL